MKLKSVGRFGTTGALVAAAFGASIVFTPASASAESEWICHGTAVERCGTVWWDDVADTYQARARITDAAGGGNHQVAVSNVRLQRFNGDKWVQVSTGGDYDGWHETEDLGVSGIVDPCNWRDQEFRVVASFTWKGAASGKETWSPKMGWIFTCP